MAIPDMLFTVVATVAFRGFGEADRFLAWALDRLVGEMPTGAGDVTPISRGNLDGSVARRVRISDPDGAQFQLNFILLALPGLLALNAENTGQVPAVSGNDPRQSRTRIRAARSWPTVSARHCPRRFGGSPHLPPRAPA